eukprot:COSAG02_NODE_3478_length_6673_cov_14.589747_6_plen_287_part_00
MQYLVGAGARACVCRAAGAWQYVMSQLLLVAPLLLGGASWHSETNTPGLSALASNVVGGNIPPPCPCDDPSLCHPLSPQPSADRDEVVAFSSWVFNGEQSKRNYTAPQLFDWAKITAWAPFEDDETGPESDQYAEMFCTAHRNGARILSWMPLPQGNTSAGSDGQPVVKRGCGVTEFYGWARQRNGDSSSQAMFNRTAVRQWAQETAACIPASGFDGVLLDQEAIDLDFNQTEKDAITFAICALKSELNTTLPGNMVAWTSDVGAYFDYAALTEKVGPVVCAAFTS